MQIFSYRKKKLATCFIYLYVKNIKNKIKSEIIIFPNVRLSIFQTINQQFS